MQLTQNFYTRNILIENPYKILRNTIIKYQGQVLDNCIIFPKFINLHGHLSYSGENIPSQNLFSWLIELVKTQKFDLKEMIEGAREALDLGTGFLVENTPRPKLSIEAMKIAGLKGLVGIEVFGSNPDEAEDIFKKHLEEYLELEKSLPESGDIELCFSPHASYDVSPKLWHLIIEWSLKNDKPVLSHIAESREEEIWHQNKDDLRLLEMKAFWSHVGVLEKKLKYWKAYSGSVNFLEKNNLLDKARLILTHLVQASRKDLELLKRPNISLVTCPRSNKYLNTGKANIKLWEELGIVYGIGTDSKASNYDLDLKKEANELNIEPLKKLELLTTIPAKILGKENEIGSIKLIDQKIQGDFQIIKIKDEDFDWLNIDPIEFIFKSS